MIYLQETKLGFVPGVVVRNLWGCQYVDWCYLGSRGVFGEILLMWNWRVVEKIEECVEAFSIACSLRGV